MAHFRTAAGQYILPIEATVAVDLVPGDLVKLTPADGETPAAIAKASTLEAATHMIALTDETIGGNHVATDMRNYAPSNKVAASVTAKRVGLYPLFNKEDVIVD